LSGKENELIGGKWDEIEGKRGRKEEIVIVVKGSC